jgi:hypothetical protein
MYKIVDLPAESKPYRQGQYVVNGQSNSSSLGICLPDKKLFLLTKEVAAKEWQGY